MPREQPRKGKKTQKKKRLKNLNVRKDNIKTPEREHRQNIPWHQPYEYFLRSVSQSSRNKSKNKPMWHQTDKLLHSKGNQKENKKTTYRMGENSFKWCNGQGLNLLNYTNNLYNWTAKKPTTQWKNRQKTWIDISPKIYRWPTSTWENAQHPWLGEKYKSKLPWHTPHTSKNGHHS